MNINAFLNNNAVLKSTLYEYYLRETRPEIISLEGLKRAYIGKFTLDEWKNEAINLGWFDEDIEFNLEDYFYFTFGGENVLFYSKVEVKEDREEKIFLTYNEEMADE